MMGAGKGTNRRVQSHTTAKKKQKQPEATVYNVSILNRVKGVAKYHEIGGPPGFITIQTPEVSIAFYPDSYSFDQYSTCNSLSAQIKGKNAKQFVKKTRRQSTFF